jgi:hypothetical protein
VERGRKSSRGGLDDSFMVGEEGGEWGGGVQRHPRGGKGAGPTSENGQREVGTDQEPTNMCDVWAAVLGLDN